MVKLSGLFKKSEQSKKQSKSKILKKGSPGPGPSSTAGALQVSGSNTQQVPQQQFPQQQVPQQQFPQQQVPQQQFLQQQQQQQQQQQNGIMLGNGGQGLTAVIEPPEGPAPNGDSGGAEVPPQLPNSSPPDSPAPSERVSHSAPTSVVPVEFNGYTSFNMGLDEAPIDAGQSDAGQGNGFGAAQVNGGSGEGGQLDNSFDGREAVNSLLETARLAGEAEQQLSGSLRVKPPRLTLPPDAGVDVDGPSASAFSGPSGSLETSQPLNQTMFQSNPLNAGFGAYNGVDGALPNHNDVYSTPIRLNDFTAPKGSGASLAGSTPSGPTPQPQKRKTKSPSSTELLNGSGSQGLQLAPPASSSGFLDASIPPPSGLLSANNGMGPYFSGRLDAPAAGSPSTPQTDMLRLQAQGSAPSTGTEILLEAHIPSPHTSGLLNAQPPSGQLNAYQPNGGYSNGFNGAQLGGLEIDPSGLSVSIPRAQTSRAQTPRAQTPRLQTPRTQTPQLVPVVSALQEGPIALQVGYNGDHRVLNAAAEPKFSSGRVHHPMYLEDMQVPPSEPGPSQQLQHDGPRAPPPAPAPTMAPVFISAPAVGGGVGTRSTGVLQKQLSTPTATRVISPEAGYEARMNFFDDSDDDSDGGGSTLDEENGSAAPKLLTLGGQASLPAPNTQQLVKAAPNFTQLGSSKGGTQSKHDFRLSLFQNPAASSNGGIVDPRGVNLKGAGENITNLDRVEYLQEFAVPPNAQLELQGRGLRGPMQPLTPSQRPGASGVYTNYYGPNSSAPQQRVMNSTYPYSQTYWNAGVYGQQAALGPDGARRTNTWEAGVGRGFWSDYYDRSNQDFYKQPPRGTYGERSASYNPYVQPTAYNPFGGRQPQGPLGPAPPPLSAAYVQYSQLNQVWDGRRADNYPTPLMYNHAHVVPPAGHQTRSHKNSKSSSRPTSRPASRPTSRPTSASKGRGGSEFTLPSANQLNGAYGPGPIAVPMGVPPSAYGPLVTQMMASKPRRTRHSSDSAATSAAAGKGGKAFGQESDMYLGANVTMAIESVGHRHLQGHKSAASAQAAQLNIHNFSALDSKMYAPTASTPRANADDVNASQMLPQQPNAATPQNAPLTVTTPRLDYNTQLQPIAPSSVQPVQVPENNGLLQPAMATPRPAAQVNGQGAAASLQQMPPNVQMSAAQMQLQQPAPMPPQIQLQQPAPMPPQNQRPQPKVQLQAPAKANGKQQKEKEKKPKEKPKEKKKEEKKKEEKKEKKEKDKKEKDKPARVRGPPQELSLQASNGNEDTLAD